MDINTIVFDESDADKSRIADAVKKLPGKTIVSPFQIEASGYEGGVFLGTGYRTEQDRNQIRFRIPKGAELIFNEPWYNHSWLRPRDISRATVAVFEYMGTKYTLGREFVG